MDTVINILITATAFFIGAKLLSGVTVKNFVQCILVAIVVGVLDFTLGNVLRIVTLGIMSLSIFTWLLNAILIQIADWFVAGIKIKNFWWSLILAAVVSITSGVLSSILK